MSSSRAATRVLTVIQITLWSAVRSSCCQGHCITAKRKAGRPRIDTSKTRDQDRVKEFARALEDVLPGKLNSNASERWQHLRDAVHSTAISIFGKKKKMSADWFEANAKVKMPVIEAKRHVLAIYKTCPSQQNLQALWATRSKVQQVAR